MGDQKNLNTEDNSTIVLIGTGPVSLLKAYLLATKNPSITIQLVDSNAQIGGAWYSEISPGGAEIECGCHIWSYVPDVYKFIENDLSIPLNYIEPKPLFVGKKIRTAYSTKNLLDSYKFIVKNAVSFKWGRIANIKEDPIHYFKLFGKRNKYPKKGSPELIKALENKLRDLANVSFQKGIRILDIEVGNKVRLHTHSGDLICDRCILTSVSEIRSIQSGEQHIEIKQEQVDYIHYLIQLNQPLLKPVSYWRLMDDDVVHRITDISYQTNNENLLLVGIKGDAFKKMNQTALMIHIQELLNSYKLCNEQHVLELVKTHNYPTFYIDENIRTQINSIGPQLELVHSTDLMYGFYYLLKEEGVM